MVTYLFKTMTHIVPKNVLFLNVTVHPFNHFQDASLSWFGGESLKCKRWRLVNSPSGPDCHQLCESITAAPNNSWWVTPVVWLLGPIWPQHTYIYLGAVEHKCIIFGCIYIVSCSCFIIWGRKYSPCLPLGGRTGLKSECWTLLAVRTYTTAQGKKKNIVLFLY